MSEKIVIETSARHGHLSEADLETLFGKGAKLTQVKELSQPGQYVCEERIQVIGPKGSFDRVVIIGPTRPQTQVEVSLTDARMLGLQTPIRESGVLGGSAGCKLVGPAGEIEIKEGVIAAKRHIHTTPDDAKKLGVTDKEIVGVRIMVDERSLVFEDVIVRVNPAYATAMHIDTDEANAAGCGPDTMGEIVKLG